MATIIAMHAKYLDDEKVEVKRSSYVGGYPALVGETEDGLLKFSVNLIAYGETPRKGHVFIKTYSENEGMLEALQKAGVVGEAVRLLDVGFVANGAAEVPVLVE